MQRKSWQQWFLELAALVGSRSKDPSTQVGAVAHDCAHGIVEVGYNGLPRGVEDRPERMERPAKYHWTVHAEANLVAQAAQSRLRGKVVTVTHMPCSQCAALLIQAGVGVVVVGDGKTSMPDEVFLISRQMFREAGVRLVMVNKEDESCWHS